MDEDLYYEKSLLSSYESELKIIKRSIKWEKVYIGLCIFNTFSFFANFIRLYDSNRLGSIMYLITDLIWIFLILFTIKSIKNKKNELKECLHKYDEKLKVIDYPKYLKTQRTKKLKKLKKSIF